MTKLTIFGKKTIAAHYLETGILGAYETASADYEEVLDGNYVLCFDDSVSHIDDTYSTIHRTMNVEGRTSIFSTQAVQTPTDKLLRLIDADLEKPDSR